MSDGMEVVVVLGFWAIMIWGYINYHNAQVVEKSPVAIEIILDK